MVQINTKNVRKILYQCKICGYIYDEYEGDSDRNIPPISWENLPEDWCCPVCGNSKSEFDKIELKV